jgi:hypothetical protein
MEENQNMTPALHSLRNDLILVGSYMRDFSAHVLNEGVSKYPMYIAYQSDELPLGRPFFDRERHHLNWNFNASVLEEFVKHEIVSRDRLDSFRETFGDPTERACIFVCLPDQQGFIFFPFGELTEDEEESMSILPEF